MVEISSDWKFPQIKSSLLGSWEKEANVNLLGIQSIWEKLSDLIFLLVWFFSSLLLLALGLIISKSICIHFYFQRLHLFQLKEWPQLQGGRGAGAKTSGEPNNWSPKFEIPQKDFYAFELFELLKRFLGSKSSLQAAQRENRVVIEPSLFNGFSTAQNP